MFDKLKFPSGNPNSGRTDSPVGVGGLFDGEIGWISGAPTDGWWQVTGLEGRGAEERGRSCCRERGVEAGE